MKFKLARKRKKKFKKDILTSNNNWTVYLENPYCIWKNFHHRELVSLCTISIVLGDAENGILLTWSELYDWYKLNYPNDIKLHNLCKQNIFKYASLSTELQHREFIYYKQKNKNKL